jgi:signal transduction histidine kinase
MRKVIPCLFTLILSIIPFTDYDQDNNLEKSVEGRVAESPRKMVIKVQYYHELVEATTQGNNLEAIKNTLWAAVIAAILLNGYGWYWYYRYKKFHIEEKIMIERQRISRELHDEMGSSLSGIVLYTHLAGYQIETLQQAEARYSLHIIQQSANDLVSKLSDWVWLANMQQDSFGKLLQKLNDYALQMAAARNIQVIFNIPKTVTEIAMPAESRHNIYLLLKEAINNAVKYSNCSILELNAQYLYNAIQCELHDNGQGFDITTIGKGNGLQNMQIRAAESGAKLHIESDYMSGTTIMLEYKVA